MSRNVPTGCEPRSAGFPVWPDHASAVADLPRLQGDPLDRMLIVQATAELLTIVTDAMFGRYDVPVITAAR
jgi:PIN domain nuclease of toxin-antitoxin system